MGPSCSSGAPSQTRSEDLPGDNGLTLSQLELIERIGWLIRLRWAAFVGVSVTVVMTRELFDSSLPTGKLLLTALTIPAYNLVCLIIWRRSREAGAKRVERLSSRLANAQILCDLAVLGALVHFSGGVENPFGFYFIFHMVIASILLPATAAYAQATVATFIFSAVAVGEYHGLLSHYRSPADIQGANLHQNPVFVFAATWVMSTSLYVTVYLATSITSRLRQREDQVVSLSQQVRGEADKLQAAYDELAEREKAESTYARKVAHEVRSPLAAIDNLLRALSEGLYGKMPAQAAQTVEQARRRVGGLLSVVNDLLALATARGARHFAQWTDLDLRSVLDEAVGVLAPQAEARQIELKTEIPQDLPAMRCDREGMLELFTNLISNAIKYSLEQGRVQVRITPENSGVRIEVSDSGIGIEESDLGNVFEEFYRTDRAREFTSEGTGLGLSIVKSTVDAHGGAIAVESRNGEGTRFIVRLPVGANK